jgi:hypothetical protein
VSRLAANVLAAVLANAKTIGGAGLGELATDTKGDADEVKEGGSLVPTHMEELGRELGLADVVLEAKGAHDGVIVLAVGPLGALLGHVIRLPRVGG